MDNAPIVACTMCGKLVAASDSYVVRIEVYADGSIPATSSQSLAAIDFDAQIDAVLSEIAGQTAEQLQDQVHRRFEFRLCGTCHRAYLANPLGAPRRLAVGSN